MANKNLGNLLKIYRKNSLLTQQQVADALNINRTTYTYYETGKTEPSIDTLHKLIKISVSHMMIYYHQKRTQRALRILS